MKKNKIVPREIKKIYDIALTDLKNSEYSEVEWERDIFKITKNLFDELILPTLKTKVNADEINTRLIFHSIFFQIRSALYWQLEKRDEKIFKYEYSGKRKKYDIISQLSSKRKISIRTEGAESFIGFCLIAPAALAHYIHSNNSKWLEEYFLKHKELLRLEAPYNKPRKASTNKVTLSEKDMLIEEIKKKKNKLRKKYPGKKTSLSAVARELEIKDSSFRDLVKNHKINFSDL